MKTSITNTSNRVMCIIFSFGAFIHTKQYQLVTLARNIQYYYIPYKHQVYVPKDGHNKNVFAMASPETN
jgi:predicted P-loop ATPase/GTPase